jgi:hypothetical protein
MQAHEYINDQREIVEGKLAKYLEENNVKIYDENNNPSPGSVNVSVIGENAGFEIIILAGKIKNTPNATNIYDHHMVHFVAANSLFVNDPMNPNSYVFLSESGNKFFDSINATLFAIADSQRYAKKPIPPQATNNPEQTLVQPLQAVEPALTRFDFPSRFTDDPTPRWGGRQPAEPAVQPSGRFATLIPTETPQEIAEKEKEEKAQKLANIFNSKGITMWDARKDPATAVPVKFIPKIVDNKAPDYAPVAIQFSLPEGCQFGTKISETLQKFNANGQNEYHFTKVINNRGKCVTAVETSMFEEMLSSMSARDGLPNLALLKAIETATDKINKCLSAADVKLYNKDGKPTNAIFMAHQGTTGVIVFHIKDGGYSFDEATSTLLLKSDEAKNLGLSFDVNNMNNTSGWGGQVRALRINADKIKDPVAMDAIRSFLGRTFIEAKSITPQQHPTDVQKPAEKSVLFASPNHAQVAELLAKHENQKPADSPADANEYKTLAAAPVVGNFNKAPTNPAIQPNAKPDLTKIFHFVSTRKDIKEIDKVIKSVSVETDISKGYKIEFTGAKYAYKLNDALKRTDQTRKVDPKSKEVVATANDINTAIDLVKVSFKDKK